MSATALPFSPFAFRADMLPGIRAGRSTLTLALSKDITDELDAGADFWLYVEKPLTAQMVRDALVAHVAARIRNGEMDAADGPVLTVGSVYRMNESLYPVRPGREMSKGQTVETLGAVYVTTQATYRAALDESIRHLVSFDAPRSWTQAETDRASKPAPAIDAAPVPQNALTDGQVAALVVEPSMRRSAPATEPFPVVTRGCFECGVLPTENPELGFHQGYCESCLAAATV